MAKRATPPLLLLFLCVAVTLAKKCPLHANNKNYFYSSATSERPVEGEGDSSTCCKDAWNDGNPFSRLVDQKMTGDVATMGLCRAKLNRMAQGLCSPYQKSVASSHAILGVAHVCDSFCTDLLQTCGDLFWKSSDPDTSEPFKNYYQEDGEYFCKDLFENPSDNLTASVLTFSSSSRGCIDDSRMECTADDVTGFYTECDVKSVTREYHYQYVEEVSCSGGVQLKSTKVGLPCVQTCEPGYYLPVGELDCQKCDAGYFSVGGGYLFDQWKDLPQIFEWETHCETNNGVYFDRPGEIIDDPECGWHVNDTFVESQKGLGDLQSAVLSSRVNLVVAGEISFVFRVDAEPLFDGLLFKIDNVTLMTFYSNSAVMETRTFNVPSGLHTFTWIYFKDFTKAKGQDQAFIQSIEIRGVKLADSTCSGCNPGKFSREGASKCSPCAANSYAGWYEAGECELCEDDEFSYPGATECSPRQPCVEDDVYSYYTPCMAGQRTKVYNFSEPMICDSTDFRPLGMGEVVPCADCNPGLFREINSTICQICAPGSKTSSPGATSCEDCPAGTSGKKELFYTQFDSWDELEGLSTWCNGDCATNGWRLMGDDIDSGVGHGSIVDSVLQIDTELIEAGNAFVRYSVVCKDFCKIAVVDVNVAGNIFTRHTSSGISNVSFHMQLRKGPHQLQIVFSKYLENTSSSRDNRMILHEFSIEGVIDAGATSCEPCPAGYFSSPKSEFCTPCPPGTYSATERAEECTPCEEGYYAPYNGTAQCSKCGDNTNSNPTKTDCDLNDCHFEIEEYGIEYDLSAIVSNMMYGPVFGGEDKDLFFLSPCQKEHDSHSCLDSDGHPIPTFACLQDSLVAPGIGIGSVQGYHALEEHVEGFEDYKRAGLVMTFDEGEQECEAVEGEHIRTSVLFLCDPNAGKGSPEIIGVPDETEPCTYRFQWESLYACPVCTEADYYPVYGTCQEGVVLKTYVPKTFPNRCHGGEVPQPEEAECDDSSVVCPLGTYLPLNLDDQDEKRHDDEIDNDTDSPCLPAPPGHFSIGGGIVADVFDSWETLPVEFGRDSTWDLLGELVRSGEGTTELKANVDVLEWGYVAFDFKIASYITSYENNNMDNFGFYFYIDSSPTPFNLTDQMMFLKHSLSFPLSAGRHTLTWLFVGGIPPKETTQTGVYVVIDKILITGTATSARSETPCREGTYQPDEGQYRCFPCPPDTFSGPGEESYHQCAEGEYSLPGSSECETKQICTMDDFSTYFTDCEEGAMYKIYKELAPGCDLRGSDLDFSDNNTKIDECFGCPEGFYFHENDCISCPLGQYLGDKNKCENVPEGTFGETKLVFFNSENVLGGEGGELPSKFRTFCSGKCDTDGWRMVSGKAQSGYYSPYSEVESALFTELDFVQKGSVSFDYTLSRFTTGITLQPSHSPAIPGFLFYMDNQQIPVNYHPSIDEEQHFTLADIPSGRHNFTWVYHQPLEPSTHLQVFIWDLEVVGTSLGGASDYKNCPAGTYSKGGKGSCTPCEAGKTSEDGASSCELCDYDKYADQEGSTTCSSCGHLINATEDRKSCDVSCTYFDVDTNHTFDVTPLSQRYSVNDGKGLRYEISLCEQLDPLVAQCQAEQDTFICISKMANGKLEQKDGGHIMNIYFDSKSREEEEETLRLVYTEGSDCLPRGQKRTEIVFICDASADLPTAPVLSSHEDCWTKFEWTHRSACPVCTDADYRVDEGSCVNGEKQVMEVRTSECNGREILSVKTVSCRNKFVPFILMAGVLVFLLVVVAVFAIRNKHLNDRYEKLVNSSNIGEDSPESDESADDVGDLKL